MQEFPVKRGQAKNLEDGGLGNIMKDIFDHSEPRDGGFISSHGAIRSIYAELKDKSTLIVDTQMDTSVSDDVALETRKKYNDFMQRATGFNAKERVKRMKKSVE